MTEHDKPEKSWSVSSLKTTTFASPRRARCTKLILAAMTVGTVVVSTAACSSESHAPRRRASDRVTPVTGTAPSKVVDPGPVTHSQPAAPSAGNGSRSSVPTAPARPATDTRTSTACPVTAETLLAALKTDARYSEAGRPDALEGATCYGDHALAHAKPDGIHQPAQALFAFQPVTKTWKPLAVSGSAHFCQAYLSNDTIQRLGGC